jgi:hypothetical protein
VAAGAGALPVPDIHADGVEGFGRAAEEFTVFVSVDCCHIADRQGRIAFVKDLEAGPSVLKDSPVLEDATAKHSFEVVA